MPSIVSCPHCQQRLKVSPQMAGRTVACPKCKGSIRVARSVSEQGSVDRLVEPESTGPLGTFESFGGADSMDGPPPFPSTPPPEPAFPRSGGSVGSFPGETAGSFPGGGAAPLARGAAPLAGGAAGPSSGNRVKRKVHPLVLVALGCGGTFVLAVVGFAVLLFVAIRQVSKESSERREAAVRSVATPDQSLLEARAAHSTRLLPQRSQPALAQPADQPPPGTLELTEYPSPIGPMQTYLSADPLDGQRHPIMIWLFGGFGNDIGDTAWMPGPPDNDQSASAYRDSGMLMMYPSLRGGNANPGQIEGFYGEVDDVIAATDFALRLPYVDPDRVYLGGHSTGGTLVLLVAASSDRYRAAFSFGPVDDVSGYGSDVLPFSPFDRREVILRSPIYWLDRIKVPVFVFEGSDQGNAQSLRILQRSTDNPMIQFMIVPRHDHFSVLSPLNQVIAQKILADTGGPTGIRITTSDLPR